MLGKKAEGEWAHITDILIKLAALVAIAAIIYFIGKKMFFVALPGT